MWMAPHTFRTLLLTFFLSLSEKLCWKVATSTIRLPAFLYKGSAVKKSHLFATTKQISKPPLDVLAARPNYTIQRFKGLGWKLMPKQLWETTMDPTTRTIERVEMKMLAEADRSSQSLW